jgi:prepilin-type N-terminal cleavage/methylation domain-containing protein
MWNRNNQRQKGFTLVELLVAVAVFMIVVTAAVGALYSIIDANRKAQSMKSVINNVSFALESISKDMRMGKDYNCNNELSPLEDVECTSDGSTVISYFSDQKNKKIWYRFNKDNSDGNIQRGYEGTSFVWENLTAPENTVKINNMKFYIIGNKDSLSQSRVLITVEGESGTKESSKTNFSLQTTVSQRTQKQL